MNRSLNPGPTDDGRGGCTGVVHGDAALAAAEGVRASVVVVRGKPRGHVIVPMSLGQVEGRVSAQAGVWRTPCSWVAWSL